MSDLSKYRDELAKALLHVQHPDNPDAPLPMVRAGCAQVLADALLASPVLAQMKREWQAEALAAVVGTALAEVDALRAEASGREGER